MCYEYPGFEREVLLINNIEVYINICEAGSNETGWSFSKRYTDYISALDSLGEYLKILRARESGLLIKTSLNRDILLDSSRRINEDVVDKKIFLPDSGEGYKYL